MPRANRHFLPGLGWRITHRCHQREFLLKFISSQGGQWRYRALVELVNQSIERDGYDHSLAPGMQVSAEINLGDRTVLEYILSPVRKAFHEAGRER